MSAGLSRTSNYTVGEISKWIFKLAYAYEAIDSEELCTIINEERIVSGFPQVIDLSMVEAGLEERRQHYRNVIKSALNNLLAQELIEVVTLLAKETTCNGEEQAPLIICDMIDSYEVEAQEFLKKESENIKEILERIKTSADAGNPDTTLSPMVYQLAHVVENWCSIAKPIQISAKSRGLDHYDSKNIANIVRDLAIHLFNEHNKIELSKQLTNILLQNFAEVVKIVERVEEDSKTLHDIEKQRANSLEKRRMEITYKADVGVIFKDRLSISPEGIVWKGRQWELDSISRIRWGGTRKSVNGIPAGTTYSITFGNESELCSIELSKKEIYENFIDRLWRAVGVRLMFQYLEGLRAGEKYKFGSALISDQGIELERMKWFSNNERVYNNWSEVLIYNGPGVFCVESKKGKVTKSFSYQDEDNIHVLEAMFRWLWKTGGRNMSSLLGEG